jgi:hypothetical protein
MADRNEHWPWKEHGRFPGKPRCTQGMAGLKRGIDLASFNLTQMAAGVNQLRTLH